MIITKNALPRRTILRGVGCAISLPLLDAMIPARTAMAKTPAAEAPRLAIFGSANGVVGPHFWPTGEAGPLISQRLTPILNPLAPVLEHTVVVRGLSNLSSESKDEGGGPHARCVGSFLSGCRPKRTEGADVRSGTSIDQFAAGHLGKATQLTSLELAIESSFAGNCDQGYSCVYQNTFSWRTPTQPLPMENNPRIVFERLFGDGGSVPARLQQMRTDRSILDWLTADIAALQKRLGPQDRAVVTEYLDALRDVEQRIRKAEQHSLTTPLPVATQPVGIPESYVDHMKLMADLQHLALQADVTRVITFQTSREQSARQFPFLGVPESHHDTSHHSNDPHKMQQNTKIMTYFMDVFANLLQRMRATKEGDGTLLDHAVLLWAVPMGSGDSHSPHDLPVVIAGGGWGRLKGGRYLQYPLDTPFMNLGLSLLDMVGASVEEIGDSTGRLADL